MPGEEKKKSRAPYIVLATVLAVIIATGVFFLGYYVRVWTQPAWVTSLEWVIETANDNYYKDIGEVDYASMTAGQFVSVYLDQYSEYYTAEEYAASLASNAGNKEGIGVSASYSRDAVTLNYVYGNSPAYEAGLRRGDRIKSGKTGDGEEVFFSSYSGFSSFISSAGDGEITLFTEDGGEFSVTSADYTAGYVLMATNECGYSVVYGEKGDAEIAECEGDAIEYLPDGAAYIYLMQFYGNAAEEFGLMLEKFYSLGCDTLYLDLRNDGGGYVSVMQYIAGYFTDAGETAMTAVYKDGHKSEYSVRKPPVDVRVDGNTQVYVLANSSTASASEALIGVLICCGAIEYSDIFISLFDDAYTSWAGNAAKNGKTYGKGIMQSTYVNGMTGEALKLTVATIYWADGTCIHDVGLSADDGCRTVEAEWNVTKPDSELGRIVEMTAGVQGIIS